ncbi:hypothetical protein PMZ80_008169 [Knufia obscura]|uniref:Uncharacterized protein n=1 Tax=Knufia obscura TaxID=1635080 RepID=A0ABR0RHR8_9EURO|nr:hypothetical protein PMZ80_008169 [Knufia obscura]
MPGHQANSQPKRRLFRSVKSHATEKIDSRPCHDGKTSPSSAAPRIEPLQECSFLFLQVPAEIRLMIYREYYGNIELEMRNDEHVSGMPSLAIELVSRQINEEAKVIREECTGTSLHVVDKSRSNDLIRSLARRGQFQWLRKHIVSLSVDRKPMPSKQLAWDN